MSRYIIDPVKYLEYDYERKDYLASEEQMIRTMNIHNECFNDEAPIENPCQLFQITDSDMKDLDAIKPYDDKVRMREYLLELYHSKNIQCEYIFVKGRHQGLRCMERRASGKTFCKCHNQQSKVKKQPEVRYSNARSALRVLFDEPQEV